MKKLMVIEIATGKVSREYNMKNVKSYCDPKSLKKMRKDEKHEFFYGMICFKGLPYDLDMFEVDKYDIKIA